MIVVSHLWISTNFIRLIFYTIIVLIVGRADRAQELLALPWTNINAQYANGNTPLILAVQGEQHIIATIHTFIFAL